MRRCVTATSDNVDYKLAFEEVCSKIDAEIEQPILIMFFSDIDMFEFSACELHKRYPKSISIGSTSYMMFSNNACAKMGFSAMAIFSGIEVTCGMVSEISRFPMNSVDNITKAYKNLTETKNCCCIEMCTSFSNGEELVLDTFASALSEYDVPVLGGSAGCPDGEENTFVALNGQVYEDSCVFVLISNLKGKIGYYKENMYSATHLYFTATDVDCEERVVYEFENVPAADYIIEKIESNEENLELDVQLHPLGRVVEDDIFITDVKQVNDDGSMQFFSRIYNMTKIALLELDDVDKVWSQTKTATKDIIPNPSFSFVINCCGRTKTFESMGILNDFVNCVSEDYGQIIGFSGYGEQINRYQLNRTLVLIMFE